MLNDDDQRVIAAVQCGFPLVSRPFQELGQTIGWDEERLLERLRDLRDQGIIKRVGVVVHHHELGFAANAMVVWDIPDETVRQIGERIRSFDFVSLCYLRQRCLPDWPYNLYCMIHGRERDETQERADRLTAECGLAHYPRAVLFSRRRFKQCGAKYFSC